MPSYQPSYRIHYDKSEIDLALDCISRYGYCIIQRMIDHSWVEELKREIDLALDPLHDLPTGSNRYHMMFAEVSDSLWRLLDHPPYLNYIHSIHRTKSLCLHRSAAILRNTGEAMGTWHSDHRGHVERPQNANDVLNRFDIPSGSWFYLNGSHPDRSGLAVIEQSHDPNWTGPEGFQRTSDGAGFRPVGSKDDSRCDWLDVPGCVAIVADPGDLICFAAHTFHVNMETNERRYSCGIGFRPKREKIIAPWPLTETAKALSGRLDENHITYLDGYTGFNGEWKASME